MDVAYMGFTQEAAIRCFRFECRIELQGSITALHRTIDFIVSADMSLFLQHQIPIQDGPAICRGVLFEATSRVPESELVPGSYAVEETHLASFAAARDADAIARSARRHKRSPHAGNQARRNARGPAEWPNQ